MIALGVLTSGCSSSEPVDICPPLPTNLEPDALEKMPRSQALTEIKNYFGIQLPPAASYTDANSDPHSATYKFVYEPALTYNWAMGDAVLGVTPWFHMPNWGDVAIGDSAFTYSDFNAYDIAATMIHESYHAWNQYTLTELAKDQDSEFYRKNMPPNIAYYTPEWSIKYNSSREFDAYNYEQLMSPTPVCISSKLANSVRLGIEFNNGGASPEGYSSSMLLGYPLP
jgi:hypothetical protein